MASILDGLQKQGTEGMYIDETKTTGHSIDLNWAISESVRETFQETCGLSVSQAIMYHLKEKYGVNLDTVASNPLKLTRALNEIFGPGFILIEGRLVANLSEKLGIRSQSGSLLELIERVKTPD